MKAFLDADIVLLDGILFVTDLGFEMPESLLTAEQQQQGFAVSEHAAMVMTGYEFCECKLEVWLSKPPIPGNIQKKVSFPLHVDSGKCCVGNHIIPDDATVDVALSPGKYLVTVIQELITEEIEDPGNAAAIMLSVCFENVQR